jgi:serine/threonine protein kinase
VNHKIMKRLLYENKTTRIGTPTAESLARAGLTDGGEYLIKQIHIEKGSHAKLRTRAWNALRVAEAVKGDLDFVQHLHVEARNEADEPVALEAILTDRTVTVSIVMEKYDNDLFELCVDEPYPLSAKDRDYIASRVYEIVHRLNTTFGVVHFDVKLENFMYRVRGGCLEIALGDFDMAQFCAGGISELHGGTLAYLPPRYLHCRVHSLIPTPEVFSVFDTWAVCCCIMIIYCNMYVFGTNCPADLLLKRQHMFMALLCDESVQVENDKVKTFFFNDFKVHVPQKWRDVFRKECELQSLAMMEPQEAVGGEVKEKHPPQSHHRLPQEARTG